MCVFVYVFLGYGVYLSEIIMNQSFDLSLRQLAAVMLTKYVEEHWAMAEENGANGGPQVVASEQVRQMIRKILPNGMALLLMYSVMIYM